MDGDHVALSTDVDEDDVDQQLLARNLQITSESAGDDGLEVPRRLTLTSFVSEYVLQLQPPPTLVVLDTLFHPGLPERELRAFLRAFKKHAPTIKLIWLAVGNKYIYAPLRKQLHGLDVKRQEEQQVELVRGMHIEVLNVTQHVAAATRGHSYQSTYDGIHFHEEVNRMLSYKLLSMLRT